MITNTTSLTPSLDPYQLRSVADCLRDKASLQALAQQWDYEGERELLIETARALGLEYLETDDVQVDPGAMEGFPIKLIHRHEVFPLERTGQFLRLAVSNPFDFNAFDSVASSLELEVRPVVATNDAVRRLIKKYLGVGAETVDGLRCGDARGSRRRRHAGGPAEGARARGAGDAEGRGGARVGWPPLQAPVLITCRRSTS